MRWPHLPRIPYGGVTFKDVKGKTISPWAIRAGMTIVETDYNHYKQSLTVVVREGA